MKSIFVFAVAAFTLAAVSEAQDGARSAPISAVRYEVTFTAANAGSRTVDVSMSFDVRGTEPVLLSLPAWTPGAYEISLFARYVREFQVVQGTAALPWDKFDHDTWRVYPSAAGRVTARFRYVADTLDNAMAWARSDFLMFNGTNFFFYPEGQGFDWPATVAINTEPGWQVATAMPSAARGDGPTFAEQNYHALVDHPFFVGRIEVDSAMISGRWARLATYPVGSVSGARRQRVWTALRAMIPPQVAIFGEVPWRTYTLLQIADSAYGGASGLEHADSHVDIVTTRALDNPFLLSLYAHEIVHAWNVKRLRPAEMVPYRYDAPQPTPLLWISEGVTDYYADIALVRGRLIDEAGFLETTEGKMRGVTALPPVSPEDASLSTWLRPVDGTHYSYYDHGSLAGLLLDVSIRDATDNARSLDDVMRALYNDTYKNGRGFSNDDWWRTVDRVAGRSFADFRARYVNGRQRLPFTSILPLAGLQVREDTVRQARLGVFVLEDSSGVRIVQLESGGAAATAGVRVGDYLVAVGDVAVTSEDFSTAFRARYDTAAPGSPLPMRVRRGAETVTLPGRLGFVTQVIYTLRVDPNASEKARTIRAGILTGNR